MTRDRRSKMSPRKRDLGTGVEPDGPFSKAWSRRSEIDVIMSFQVAGKIDLAEMWSLGRSRHLYVLLFLFCRGFHT